MMIFNINNVIIKNETIATQQTPIETLRQEVIDLQKKDEALEQKIKNKNKRLLNCKKRFLQPEEIG